MTTTTDQNFMRQALEQATIALQNNWIPVGATFVDSSSNIIAHGKKDGTKHPRFDHAEHNGCYQALWAGRTGPRDLSDVTVYSTMEPCIMCMSMLMTTRVKRIVYGMEDPHGGGGFMVRNPDVLPHRFKEKRPQLDGNCLREESRTLLRQYFGNNPSPSWQDKENALVKACCT